MHRKLLLMTCVMSCVPACDQAKETLDLRSNNSSSAQDSQEDDFSIINGKEVAEESFAYGNTAYITISFEPVLGGKKLKALRNSCTGVLVGANKVLTANHCVSIGRYDLPPEKEYPDFYSNRQLYTDTTPIVTAYFKVNNVADDIDAYFFDGKEVPPTGKFISIGSVAVEKHPNYDPDVEILTSPNDVAILTLSRSVQPSEGLRPAKILTDQHASFSWIYGKGTALVAGFGTTKVFKESFPRRMQQTDIILKPFAACSLIDGILSADNRMPSDYTAEDWLCNIGTERYLPTTKPMTRRQFKGIFRHLKRHKFVTQVVDSCSGDSGGPVFVRDDKGDYWLAALVSAGVSYKNADCGIFGTNQRLASRTVGPWLREKLQLAAEYPAGYAARSTSDCSDRHGTDRSTCEASAAGLSCKWYAAVDFADGYCATSLRNVQWERCKLFTTKKACRSYTFFNPDSQEEESACRWDSDKKVCSYGY